MPDDHHRITGGDGLITAKALAYAITIAWIELFRRVCI
jgi:hypothetical protein